MIKKSQISSLLRSINLIYTSDKIRFELEKRRMKKKNDAFKENHPEVVLPPDYLMYESFKMDYESYYASGKKTAELLKAHFEKYIELKNLKILDWGCGPGRVIRHFPEIIGNDCEFYGTDYNSKTIDWCKNNLEGINFNNNTLEASLIYDDNTFDIIYGLSIFTHLSEKMHYEWYKELHRVLKPGGFMFISLQGDNFKVKLTENELEIYNRGDIVVRGKVKEGHRTFSAFHPTPFAKKLFNNAKIAEHIVLKSDTKSWVPQDIWVVEKT